MVMIIYFIYFLHSLSFLSFFPFISFSSFCKWWSSYWWHLIFCPGQDLSVSVDQCCWNKVKQKQWKFIVLLYTVSILHTCREESQWIRFGGVVTGRKKFWLKWKSVCLWMCVCMLPCKGAHARVCLCLCFSTRMHSNTKYTHHFCHVSWG